MSTNPRWFDGYDDEFKYADDLTNDPRLAAELAAYESGPRSKSSSQTLEEYARLHEMNTESRKKYRWEQQDEFQQAREGRILPYIQFLTMLKTVVPGVYLSEKGGMAKTLGLYVNHEGVRANCKHDEASPQSCACHVCKSGGHYVAWIQVPFMQEYEEMFFDRYDVPLGPKRRGWRTVLLRLIAEKFLTEEEAHQVFGEPATGPVSRRYRQTLQYLRGLPR